MVSRRALLVRAAGVFGGAGAVWLLNACASPAPAAPTTAPARPAAPTAAPAATAAPATAAPQPAATAAQAAAPTQAAPAAKTGGQVASAITADPRSFDPGFTQGVAGREVTRLFFDPLVNIDENGKLVPWLAERWDQPDAKTFVLHLKQGVKFHDGTAFDAEAVKAHFDYHLDPANKSLRRSEITTIDKVTPVDSNTIRFDLKEPFAAFLAPLFDLSGFIESPTARQKYGEDFGQHPVGTGPFKLVSYQKDANTTVERNPDYWRPGFPKVDRVVLRPIPVDSTRLTEVRTGGVQIASDPPFQQLDALRKASDVKLSEKNGFRWDYMAFNASTEIGGNKPLRQAFNYAVDREAIQSVVYANTGAIAYDPYLPGSAFYDASYKPVTRDVEKAKQLIQQSGVATPLQLDVVITADPVKQRVAQIVQQNVAEIGVQLSFRQQDAAAQTSTIEQGTYTFDPGWGWFGYRPDVDQYLYILTQSKGSRNIGHYNNPEVDQLLAQERSATSENDRRTAFRKIADLLNDDAVYISYHFGADFKVMSPTLTGFVHRPDGIIRYDELSLG